MLSYQVYVAGTGLIAVMSLFGLAFIIFVGQCENIWPEGVCCNRCRIDLGYTLDFFSLSSLQ